MAAHLTFWYFGCAGNSSQKLMKCEFERKEVSEYFEREEVNEECEFEREFEEREEV